MASSSTSEQKKKIRLKSADNELFDVDEDAALQSETIKNLLQEISGDQIVPLPNVTSKILAKVIEYCSNMCELDQIISVNKQWESFFKNCDQDTLFDTILAANYLSIKSLLDLTCKCVADMMKGKTPEEIREKFHIVNDLTPEEEAKIKAGISWAFE
ncbi:SKP1-like protein 1B [Beta vulgaris subsp. vulgaris]|uniref:SKP1-like protein 1B n=1 Tax=Beta vulgaris subsp. vulgaris TaxID=3555 RepID=UPI00203720FD|nr:SKP1-like protein 1B [Beta vulgaris subsp. vulgaris]